MMALELLQLVLYIGRRLLIMDIARNLTMKEFITIRDELLHIQELLYSVDGGRNKVD